MNFVLSIKIVRVLGNDIGSKTFGGFNTKKFPKKARRNTKNDLRNDTPTYCSPGAEATGLDISPK